MNRRTFLKINLAATAFGFLGNWGTLAQIRAYKQLDKPLLTERNLTRLFADAQVAGTFGDLVQEAHTDIPAFLQKHFSVSPNQRLTINAFTPDRISRIKEALAFAQEKKGSLNFKFVNTSECSEVIEVNTAAEKRTVVTQKSVEAAVRAQMIMLKATQR